jgi:hypothetical protein
VLTHRKPSNEARPSRSRRWQPLVGLIAVGLALFACNLFGGQTGTEATPPNQHEDDGKGGTYRPTDDLASAYCESKSSVVDPDDAKALGFSAEDVLSMAEGVHEASLAWRDPSSLEAFGANGTFGPNEQDDRITLTVTYSDGEVRLVRFTPKEQQEADGGSGIAVDISCPPDQLEIEVRIQLQTSGGAFDESFDAVLAASDPLVATVSHQLPRNEIEGAFEVELGDVPSGTTITVGPVDVRASLYGGGMSGTLSSSISLEGNGVASQGIMEYAHWPADDPCTQGPLNANGVGGVPVELGAEYRDTTAAEVLDELEALSGVRVTWTDGSRTQASLALTARGSTACLLTGDASPAPDSAALLRVPVDIALETADGRVDTSLAGTLDVAGAADSAPILLSVAATRRCGSDDAAAECGWPDETADGYEALRVDLSFETEQPAQADTIRGTLTLAGITSPDCTVEPAPAPDEGGSAASPGCAGEQRTEIETGAIGAP